MKKDDEPSIIFEHLSAIENRFNKPGQQIPDDDLIAAVLTAAPKEYVSILSTAEQRSKGVALRLMDLESAMTQHWRQTTGTLSAAEEGNEVIFLGFNGICYNCQKPGHRANQCPKKANRNTGGRNNNNDRNFSRGGQGRGNGGNKNYKFKGNCNNCGKQGHAEDTCWMLPSNASKRPAWFKPCEDDTETGAVANEAGNKVEYLLMAMEFPTDQKFLDNPNVWIGNTGASVHMSPHRSGMHDVKKAKSVDAITMTNGSSEDATVIDNISGRVCDKNGNVLNDAKITDVTHLPEVKYNLFSITKLQNEGWILSGNSDAIWLTKGDVEIKFDIKIPTPKGVLYVMYHQRDTEIAVPTVTAHNQDTPTVAAVTPTLKRMSVKKAHDMLGHINEKAVRKTAIALGWELTRGTLGVCEPRTEAKAKQKHLPRHPDAPPSTKDENCIYLDIATIKKTKKGPKVYKGNRRIMVEERTQLKFSDFFDTKNGMVEETCEQLHCWKESGRRAKIIRLDNAGENKLLQQRSQSADWKLNVNFEFTARDTPQQNHLAEPGFSHLANYGKALMAHANVPLNIQYKVFTKAFKTATLLDGLTVIKIGNK
jgi:hypothetical protein